MFGLGGLNYHLAVSLTATTSAGKLHNGLECALRGAVIRRIEQIVRIQHTDKRNARKIKAFGYYLCSDQNVGFASLEGFDNAVAGTLRGQRIAVESCYPSLGEEGSNLLLDLLGAEAHRYYLSGLARRTSARLGHRISAVVTDKSTASVQRECDVAVGASCRPAAISARYEG